MAQAADAFTKVRLTAASDAGGAAVAAPSQPDDNHDLVTVTNLGGANTLLVQILEQSVAAAAALTNTNAVEIEPTDSYTFPIGTTAHREPYAAAAGSKTFWYNGIGGTTDVQAVYLKKSD
jgi:hypothetical protein